MAVRSRRASYCEFLGARHKTHMLGLRSKQREELRMHSFVSSPPAIVQEFGLS